jgi:hypothetical protein
MNTKSYIILIFKLYIREIISSPKLRKGKTICHLIKINEVLKN